MEPLIRPVRLPEGKQLPGNIFLAPLAGFTDAAFRSVCIDYGAQFTYTEMVSAEGIARDSGKTFALLEKAPNEEQYGIQIFASSPESAAACVEKILPFRPFLIDLNCGCPVPKVTKTGAGSALLKNPALLKEIVQTVKSAVLQHRSPASVSVKIRSGWEKENLNFQDTAAAAAEGGADMICLHPRTRSQMYSGKADWDHIRALKTVLSVPVIGSGDLFSAEDAKKMLEETGCDGVMFARGAIGNPFIFRETVELCSTGKTPAYADAKEKIQTALEHLHRLAEMTGEQKACREMRKHFCAYTKGIPGGAALRNALIHASTIGEYREITAAFL